MANLLKIKALCKERKIDIGELSQKIGITPQAMHKLIRNGSTSIITLEKIADVLSVPASIFFDGTDTIPMANENLLKIIAEKDRQITEKDAQIKRLFDLLEKK